MADAKSLIKVELGCCCCILAQVQFEQGPSAGRNTGARLPERLQKIPAHHQSAGDEVSALCPRRRLRLCPRTGRAAEGRLSRRGGRLRTNAKQRRIGAQAVLGTRQFRG